MTQNIVITQAAIASPSNRVEYVLTGGERPKAVSCDRKKALSIQPKMVTSSKRTQMCLYS